MDLSSIKLCRLCLQTNDDAVNIWEMYQDSTIASIVTKHFWFQINKGDGLTEFVCDVCWIQTKTFHQFYKQIELYQKSLYDSVADDNPIAYVDCADNVAERAVKCEEIESKPEAIDSLIQQGHNDFECDEFEVEIESEPEQSDDEQDECVNEGQEPAPSVAKKRLYLSLSEKAALDERVRGLFKMECEFCSDVKFGSLSEARRHYRTVHRKKGYIECCGKRMNDMITVANHVRSQHDHHVQSNGLFEHDAQIREWVRMECDICTDPVRFQTVLEMQPHFRKVHNTRGYLRGACCGKKLFYPAQMLNHIRWHTSSKQLRCVQCDQTFCHISALRNHFASHMSRDSPFFKCTFCKSRFALASSLRSHITKQHTTKIGEKFDCDRCTKSFQSNYLLSHHIRNSHESTTYICDICGEKFRTKVTLQHHFGSFHSSKPPARVQCDVCGVWLKSLRYHRPMCNKTSSNKNSPRGHISSAHGKKKQFSDY